MTRGIAAALIALAVTGAGCASDGKSDEAAGELAGPLRLDPCSVLRTEDVNATVGVALARREPDAETPGSRCFYTLQDNTNLNVTIDYEQGKSWFGAAGPGTAVAGVGDEAKWVAVSQLLAAYEGPRYVAVLLVSRESEDVRKQKAAAVARVALSRMK